jgi:hypothetical protein
LQDLSKEVTCAVHLGVELGLRMPAIESILKKYPNDMPKQVLGVMKEWMKNTSNVKATILRLMKAMQSADGNGLTFLIEKYG